MDLESTCGATVSGREDELVDASGREDELVDASGLADRLVEVTLPR